MERAPYVRVEEGEPELDHAAQFAMIRHMRDRLAKRGIELLVIPFPFREQVDGRIEFADPGHRRFIAQREELLGWMVEQGIAYVDLAAPFKEALREGQRIYYEGEDDHPTDAALKVAGRVIAEALTQDRQWTAAQPAYTHRTIAFARRPEYSAEQVLSPGGEPLAFDEPSPVLVAGDSYTRYPEETPYGSIPSAHLAAQIARNLDVVPRNYSVSSGGACMPMLLARRPELLDGVEICVFVFSPYYPWTSGGRMWECVDF